MKREYKISNHVSQRYAERIMKKPDQNEINRFVLENEAKIKNDIHKMIEYGELIFTGKQSNTKDKGKVIDVYLKDTWVILVDESSGVVVTLYKIDLGCEDEEFNLKYILKMKEKLQNKKNELKKAKNDVETESSMYKAMIEDNTAQINMYKGYIKNLQTLNESYETIVKNTIIKVSVAEEEVASVVNNLIGKKEF